MKALNRGFGSTVLWFCFLGLVLANYPCFSGTTHYVDVNGTNATRPFTNWATAALRIQDAIDAAVWQDEILVADGVYAAGGRAVTGVLTNRIWSDKRLTIRSVNGPARTIIQGYQVPGTTNGDSAIRCAYLGNEDVLSGFTLTGGATRATGGSSTADCGGGVWVSTSKAVVSNCVLIANSASYLGGGFYSPGNSGSLVDCKVMFNWAAQGGGVGSGTLDRCMVISNTAATSGGGVSSCLLSHCSIFGNSASDGGGACSGMLLNCTLTGNWANRGGGAYRAELDNCIVYYNSSHISGPNYDNGTVGVLNYCCTTPLPTNGIGNQAGDPQLASPSHLSATSPCRGAGSSDYAWGTDIDGESWSIPPSIGCDESKVGALTGPLTVDAAVSFTNVSPGFVVDLAALIDGRTTRSQWDLGDGTTLANQPCPSHAWTTPGEFMVTLTAFNEDYPEGVSDSISIHVQNAPTHYVALGSTNPTPPFLSWATAAADIQSAVDAVTTAGARILVNDGVYEVGGRTAVGALTNRVVIDKPVTVQSVNGAAKTIIRGYQVPGSTNGDGAIRCVYLADLAVLSGFTLTNGGTRSFYSAEGERNGGAVWCGSISAVLDRCVLSGNSAGDTGGGANLGTLNNCILMGNSALNGGGAYGSILNNCTVTGNAAMLQGGGGHSCSLTNCIVYFNKRGDTYQSSMDHCCTATASTTGSGNFTNDPLFMDSAAANLRLQSNSPCINAGRNACVYTDNDLDGNPRVAGGTVDVGAYETLNPGSVISYAWLTSYGLPTDGSVDLVDLDGDGMSTYQEWRCQTDPTNSLSVLRLTSVALAESCVDVAWQSVPGVIYLLERGTNLAFDCPFELLATNIMGQSSTTIFRDITAPRSAALFYRVAVRE